MDRTKKGVRSVKGERAANQFWWMEDVGIADSGYKEGRDLTPIRVYFCREVSCPPSSSSRRSLPPSAHAHRSGASRGERSPRGPAAAA